ncbi:MULTISPECIES: helix-turn-helix transcriptional regulator [unclassified Streptomyces]|uniref:helix-turn-helix domain-containing protein n=1 Tax=unclassified Streptomyces TaxID=2593676 RepID=UPI002E133DCD|nr:MULTISPECIES: helix-turn-helix transcriptional regulator [unclassified Streptomyces]WSR21673.1 helix-turn-helix domain-containing protein [Streptomyces sp. NBC_01205]
MEHDQSPTFAQLLDHLFREVHPPSRGPYTYAEVAEGIRKVSSGEGRGVTASAIQQLRTGVKQNPTRHTIKALADFFGVPAGYFVDGAAAERTKAEIGLLTAMRDQDVRKVALRANGLSVDSLKMLSTVIEQARKLEGLTHDESPHDLNLDD